MAKRNGANARTPRPDPAPSAEPSVIDPRRFRVEWGFIDYPANLTPELLARLLRGDDVPASERAERRAVEGDVINDLPACSASVLLGSGQIVAVDARGNPVTRRPVEPEPAPVPEDNGSGAPDFPPAEPDALPALESGGDA